MKSTKLQKLLFSSVSNSQSLNSVHLSTSPITCSSELSNLTK